jgi:benzoyl-CoA reductase/2-hydroxyglutaryl-CoA dehydratase subunit BcrC/BadD/HgdB
VTTPLEALHAAARDPRRAAAAWRGSGPVVGIIGLCVPEEPVLAAGLRRVRLGVDAGALADALANPVAGLGIGPMAAVHLGRLRSGAYDWLDLLVIGHDSEEHARLFAVARELHRCGDLPSGPPVAFLDVPRLAGEAGATYHRDRLAQFLDRLAALTDRTGSDDDLRAALGASGTWARQRHTIGELRHSTPAMLSGVDALAVHRARDVMDPAAHDELTARLLAETGDLPRYGGRRLFLAGSVPPGDVLHVAAESRGMVVVDEDHRWGLAEDATELAPAADPLTVLAERAARRRPPTAFSSPRQRAEAVTAAAQWAGADAILHVVLDHDRSAAWDGPALVERAADLNLPVVLTRDDPVLSGATDWMVRIDDAMARPEVPVR